MRMKHTALPVLILTALALVTASCAGNRAGGDDFTVVYVARHAEKEAGVRDPGLVAAGKQRAEALADICAGAGVSAVYSTPFTRTLETARPTAERVGVEIDASFGPGREADMAGEILSVHRGERLLVVGHSNTLSVIVAALGGDGSFGHLPERVYDRLYFVTVHANGRVQTSERRYGAPTP